MPTIDATALALALANVVLGVVVLILAKLLKPVLSPYRADEELTTRDNPAFGLALAGYYAAVVAVFIGVTRAGAVPLDAGTGEVARALAADAGWALAGVGVLAGSRWLLDRLLVPRCRLSDEIVTQRNTAAGAVECGVYVASGLALAGAWREPGGTVVTALGFYALCLIALIGFGRLYGRVAGYRVADEVRGGNLAAGVAFGLTLVALGLLLLKATSGEFVDWPTNLSFFAFDAVAGFALLLLLRWLTDAALLPNARIAAEIVGDRNTGVGLVEGTLAVCVAAMILFVF